MLDIHAITKAFELNKLEGEILEHLLENGRTKAVDLRRVLHLDRATFYRLLKELELKDLLVISGSPRQQAVALQDIKMLSTLLTTRKSNLIAAEKALKDLQANMRDLRDNRYRQDNVEVISGKDAYLKSMLSLIRGGGKLLRDITPDSGTLYKMAGDKTNYEGIVRIVKAERLRKKIAIQILFDGSAKEIDHHSRTSSVDLKEVRKFDKKLKLDCYVNTCGTRTLFYTKDATGSWGILIKDPLITNLINSLFDVVWSMAHPL